MAEWVPMEALLEVAPTITKEERVETVSSYIEKSDDFKQHFEMFVKKTDQLLKEKRVNQRTLKKPVVGFVL